MKHSDSLRENADRISRCLYFICV